MNANSKIEYLKGLEEIPGESIVSASLIYGANSKYGIVFSEMRQLLDEHLTPIVCYDREAGRVIVTSDEFLANKFH
jgi:hypothetical protein